MWKYKLSFKIQFGFKANKNNNYGNKYKCKR